VVWVSRGRKGGGEQEALFRFLRSQLGRGEGGENGVGEEEEGQERERRGEERNGINGSYVT
jgi:hypothetical protein